MAKFDLFWQSYKLLEREVIDISNVILFDDNNLSTYSLKIADLIMRVNVEIEAIAKELHQDNGGPAPANSKFLIYDSECLKFLDQSWSLSKKIVTIVYNMAFFTKPENINLRPLKEAHKTGSAAPQWKQAYQALKHDRSNSIEKASLKNLLWSLAALFLLNIYHTNYKENLGTLINKQNVDLTFGSKLFAVQAYEENQFDYQDLTTNDDNVVKSTVLVYPLKEDITKLRELEADFQSKRVERIVNELNKDQETLAGLTQQANPSEAIQDFVTKKLKESFASDFNTIGFELRQFPPKIRYVAELNKNQFLQTASTSPSSTQ